MKRNEKEKKKYIYIYILCDICLMFSLKFGRKLIFFFFWLQGIVNLMGLALFEKKKSQKRGKIMELRLK